MTRDFEQNLVDVECLSMDLVILVGHNYLKGSKSLNSAHGAENWNHQ